jgi:PLP dependent protein
MPNASEKLNAIRQRLCAAAAAVGRDPAGISLLAVSKTFPAEAVLELFDAGQRSFAESRQQEAETKLPLLPADIDWHFIGHLQRNKVRKVLESFATLHSVDSLRLARHIDSVAAELAIRPRLYLQVNIAAEPSKHGFAPQQLLAELPELAQLPHIEILGLMAIPPDEDHPEASRPWFAAMRTLRDHAQQQSPLKLPGLSMGMSGDFEIAIQEGATIVRVGSAIFGDRHYPPA